jgi:transposase
MDNHGKIIQRKRIRSKREDIEMFFNQRRECSVVIESTGVWEYIYETIASDGISVVLANPY